MFAKILSHPILAAAGVFVGWEAYKRWKLAKGPAGGFTMTPGHLFAITLGYSGAGTGGNLTTNQGQQALDTNNLGLFDVLSVQVVPTSKLIEVSAVFTGPAPVAITPAHLAGGWPTAYGTITVNSVQDMGGAPQVAPSTSSASS